ncbi:MAG: flagellar export chaperone FliS [Lachnospira sp.]|nr:flagellar export chaperone FliS [Lachnospira sp.]
MALNQAYDQYNKNKIMTASPAELTLLLYEGAIKFCNVAIVGIEQGDIMKTHNNIKKVEAIIEEFQSTLNYDYPVAQDFNRIYEYIYDLLVQANIKKDKELLERALTELRGMRDTWKEVMAKTKGPSTPSGGFMA